MNSNLTTEQDNAKKILDQDVDEIDELKQKHNEDMTAIDTEAKTHEASVPILQKDEDNKTNALGDAKQQEEKSWSLFEASKPIEYSYVKMLYHIGNYTEKAAQWIVTPRKAVAEIDVVVARDEKF